MSTNLHEDHQTETCLNQTNSSYMYTPPPKKKIYFMIRREYSSNKQQLEITYCIFDLNIHYSKTSNAVSVILLPLWPAGIGQVAFSLAILTVAMQPENWAWWQKDEQRLGYIKIFNSW